MNPTLGLDDAARRRWDVIVVGAGPAGTLAARALARRGLRLLLVDEATYPRAKACGGCLGAAAMDVLERAGLGSLTKRLGAPTTGSLRWHYGRQEIVLPLPEGAAVSRATLDAALAREAVTAGAEFLPQTTARLGEVSTGARQVILQ